FQVLGTFKKLHRTRINTFRDDKYALEATRKKINDEYRKCKDITDENKIADLNEFALAVEREVRTTIVQAREVEPGKFALRVTKDTEKLDNATLDAAGCSTSTQQKSSSNFKKCSDATNTS
ncbi:complex III assembly factor LYRM7-like, partial [Diprion similis]|uniref:complex III assembly factor LYRM7-like n=1 Tax=Diprion similis TaxID=362088 RepID=UPI001EF9049B